MARTIGLVLVSVVVAACGQATLPAPSIPPAPVPPDGWSMLATAGSNGPGRHGLKVTTAAASRQLAISATCDGSGTLTVAYGNGEVPPADGQAAVAFPCAPGGSTGRMVLPNLSGPGELMFMAGIVPSGGPSDPASFVIQVEQADR